MRLVYTKEQYEQAKKLKKKGKRMFEIALLLDISYDVIKGWLSRGRKPKIYYSESNKASQIACRMGNQNRIKYTIPKLNNIDFAYLVGVLLSDGNIDKRSFRMSVIDKEYAELFQQKVYSVFQKKCKIRIIKTNIPNRNTQYEIKFNSIQIVKYFKKICYINNKKRIPKYYFNTCDNIKWELIKGIYDGDGSIYSCFRNKDKKYKQYRISITCQFKELATDIYNILKTLNVKSRIDKDRQYYKVVIDGKKNIIRLQPFFFNMSRKKYKVII